MSENIEIVLGWEQPPVFGKCKLCNGSMTPIEGNMLSCDACHVTYLDGAVVSDAWEVKPGKLKSCYKAVVTHMGVKRVIHVAAKDQYQAMDKVKARFPVVNSLHLVFEGSFLD